jgi:hypothetical protein
MMVMKGEVVRKSTRAMAGLIFLLLPSTRSTLCASSSCAMMATFPRKPAITDHTPRIIRPVLVLQIHVGYPDI